MAGRFISFHLLLAARRSRATSIHRLIISPIPCHVMAPPRPTISDAMLLIVVCRRLFILTY